MEKYQGASYYRRGKIASLAFLHEKKARPNISGYHNFCFYCRIASLFALF
jgi:hypothetical protein